MATQQIPQSCIRALDTIIPTTTRPTSSLVDRGVEETLIS